MEIRQLRYLCAIAEHQSFRSAAAELLVAQPALSQQIGRLEAELGVKLFNRNRRPVRLTPAGECFMPRARQILADLDHAAAEAREFGGEFRGRVAFGAMQYLTGLELPDLLMAFGADHPSVQLNLRVGNTSQLRELLVADEVDLAVAHADGLDLPAEYAVEVLRSEELVILVDRANPLARARHVRVDDLEHLPFILFEDGPSMRHTLERTFSQSQLRLNVTLQTSDLRTAVSLVARGFGAAVVPRSIAMREMADVAGVRIGPVPLMRHLALVWNGERHRSRASDAFAVYVRRVFQPAAPNSRLAP
jgi:DNA-binding transcriptional LysR family regulator